MFLRFPVSAKTADRPRVQMGIGLTMQNSLFAMQAEFNNTPKLLSQATGMATFSQVRNTFLGILSS